MVSMSFRRLAQASKTRETGKPCMIAARRTVQAADHQQTISIIDEDIKLSATYRVEPLIGNVAVVSRDQWRQRSLLRRSSARWWCSLRCHDDIPTRSSSYPSQQRDFQSASAVSAAQCVSAGHHSGHKSCICVILALAERLESCNDISCRQGKPRAGGICLCTV